jgi:hypothetical protein
MGKRKGRQRDTEFTLFSDDEFAVQFYSRRATFSASFRLRVEREAKARGLRNIQKRSNKAP